MGLIMIFFMVLVLLSPVVSLTTSSWLIYWSGMELGLMSIFPIMYNYNSLKSGEACVKYFLVQSMASILMFFGGSMIFMLSVVNIYSELMLVLSLLMKLGVFPFHFWVIPVIENIWYFQMILILVPLKIPALALVNYISKLIEIQTFLLIISYFTMLIGGMLGNNCSNVRGLMAASSIGHSGWFIMSSLAGGMWLYFTVYSFILILTLFFIWYNNNFMSSLMVLSLSGLPPFLLFVVKFFVILSMMSSGYSFYFLVWPILSVVLSLNFYLKLSYSFYFNSMKTKFGYYFSSAVILNMLGGLMMYTML